MIKFNKIIKRSALLLAAALMLPACQDKLDLNPKSAIGDNGFYTNNNEVQGAVIAIYDGLQAVPLREFALTEMRSDNAKSKSREGDWAQFEAFDVKPTNQVVSLYWAANYNVIFRANTVLANLGAVTDATLSSQFEGEAKFARALAHFNMVRAYGDVPMLDKVVIQSDEDYFDRDAAATVLAFVASDLTRAAAVLPARSATTFGRADKGAAKALLAKVKLTLGDYSGAEALLSEVIADPNYALESNYSDVFFSEGNKEIIFAIPYLNDDTNESQDFSFEMTAGGLASGLNYLTDEFKAAVNPADTERNTVTINSVSGDRETGKFVSTSSNSRLCGNDWIVLRLADVYLMHSEAVMAGGASTQSAGAIASFNKVRARVGMGQLSGGDVLTREMLLNERRVELAFENHRLYDLVRFGVAEEVLGAFATQNSHAFTATDLLLPIPQNEINVSQGKLSQNPGY